MDKSSLRKTMKEKLKEFSSQNVDALISSNLNKLLIDIKFHKKLTGLCIGGYSPIQDEPIWFKSLSLDAQLCLVHMHEGRKLSYHPCSWDDLKAGKTSLKLRDEFLKNEVDPDVILIPGLAFTKEKHRLGRGAGYFDTFLEHFKGIKIGIFYECQKVENVFEEEHDQKLDYIITETRVY